MARKPARSPGPSIETAASRLRDRAHASYDDLLLVGRSGLPRHAVLVEPYLESPSDPMMARLALQTLCSSFDLAPRYRDAIERFLRKVA